MHPHDMHVPEPRSSAYSLDSYILSSDIFELLRVDRVHSCCAQLGAFQKLVKKKSSMIKPPFRTALDGGTRTILEITNPVCIQLAANAREGTSSITADRFDLLNMRIH